MSNISVINYILSEYTQPSLEGEIVQVGFNTYDMVFEITYRNKHKVQELNYDLDNMIQYCTKVKEHLKTLKGFRTAEQLFDELKDFKL